MGDTNLKPNKRKSNNIIFVKTTLTPNSFLYFMLYILLTLRIAFFIATSKEKKTKIKVDTTIGTTESIT